MFEWFTTIPGILITCGVVLLIISVILFIIGTKNEKKEAKKEKPVEVKAVKEEPVETKEETLEEEPVVELPIEEKEDTIEIKFEDEEEVKEEL